MTLPGGRPPARLGIAAAAAASRRCRPAARAADVLEPARPAAGMREAGLDVPRLEKPPECQPSCGFLNHHLGLMLMGFSFWAGGGLKGICKEPLARLSCTTPPFPAGYY